MSNHSNAIDYNEQVIHFNDKRLNAIIKEYHKHPYELVVACRKEKLIRTKGETAASSIPQDNILDEDNLTFIKRQLSRGVSIDNCEALLLKRGLSQNETLSILEKAARSAPLKEQVIKKEESSQVSIWSIIIITFFVLRMIYRFA